MYIKIFASILILGGFSSIGFYYSFKPVYRRNDLIALKRAILSLVCEMRFLSNIKEAIQNIEPSLEKPIKNIFSTFYKNIEKRRGEDLYILWEDAVNTHIKNTYFSLEDKEQLKLIGKSLSSIDKDFNIEGLNIVISYIDDKIKGIEEEKRKNTKMYQSLGVLSGLMMIILLI